MNNIRQIIEERLDNANLDYRYWLSSVGFDGIIEPDFYKIEGQIEAYQDCLNLIPAPRTEADILNDFEKFGWNIADGYVNFTLKKNVLEKGEFFDYNWHCYISIDKGNKTYNAKKICNFTTNGYDLTFQEHKLLNELFICWGWL